MNSVGERHTESLLRLSELMRRVNSPTNLDDMLEEIAHGVVEVLGYGVACIDVRHDDEMVMTAVAGPDDVVQQLLGRRAPVARLLEEFALYAEEWGILRYISHDDLLYMEDSWVPDIEVSDEPDAWHPLDALYAPLYAADGELIGNLSVDLPPRNKMPSPEDRELLEMFAVQAGLAVAHARHREQLDQQLQLASVVREVSEGARLGSLDITVARAGERVLGGLRLRHLWIRCFPSGSFEDVDGSVVFATHPGAVPDLVPAKRALAELAVQQGAPLMVSRDGLEELPMCPELRAEVRELLESIGARDLLVAPLAVGSELFGWMVMNRTPGFTSWTDDELTSVFEIGSTLGRAALDSRLFARERQLVRELQDLDRYRSELIATISHELKTPLTSIMGHVELLEDLDTGIDSVAAISRNAERLDRLVQNLLAYSRVMEKDLVREPVDLVELLASSRELFSLAAEHGRVGLSQAPCQRPVTVTGDSEELGQVVDNLVGNAVKYTRSGGRVELWLTWDTEYAEVHVRDTGMGISEADQAQLFSAFNRSTNPAAQSIPGTGLGLAISQRIVRMHGGDILVSSRLGEGSEFVLRMPLRQIVRLPPPADGSAAEL